MADFNRTDLRGSRFEETDLNGARLSDLDVLAGS